MLVTTEYPETVTAAQIIADNLAPLGITVNIRTVDFATWLDEQNNGNFDMLMMGWLGNIDPDDFYYAQHHSKGSSNAQKFSNAEVDRLLDAGRVETNRDASADDYAKAATIIADEVSYIYLYNPSVIQAWTTDCPDTRRAATAPSGSAPRPWLPTEMRHDECRDQPGRSIRRTPRAVFARGAVGGARGGLCPGAPGARRPGPHRAGDALYAGGLQRAPVGQRARSPDRHAVLRLPRIGADRRSRGELPQRRPGHRHLARAAARDGLAGLGGHRDRAADRAARRHLVGAARRPVLGRDRPGHQPVRGVDTRFLDGRFC